MNAYNYHRIQQETRRFIAELNYDELLWFAMRSDIVVKECEEELRKRLNRNLVRK